MAQRSARGGARTVTTVLLLLGAVVLVWYLSAADAPWRHTRADPPATPGAATAEGGGIPSRPDDAFPLTVTYVFDGDTIEARAATPNEVVGTTDPVRVRLIGIDTPEGTPTPECWAEEARTHLVSMLPEGSTVWAAPDTEPRDRYDRALLYLWTDDGRFVNLDLVAAGDAEALRVPPNTAHAELFASAQAEAEASGAGRWGVCD